MNGAEWFFLEAGRQMGPVPFEQLVTLLKTRLPQDTLVWRDGMADWLKATEVAELAPAFRPDAAAPPPPAPRPSASSASSPRAGGSAAAPSRPTYRIPASASAPRGSGTRPDDEPYTLNPFALFARCFRFAGRFDRAQFAIAYLGNAFFVFCLVMGLGLVAGASGGRDAPNLMVGGLFLLLTPVILGIALGSIVRRLHDLAQPGWYVLAILVPCVGLLFLIYLLAAPGNDQGTPTSMGGVPAILIGVVVVFVGIAGIGIVAAIAIPSLLRARVSANEAATIGDIRTLISAQAVYQSMNGGFYEGRLECLAKPDDCLSNSTSPPLLDKAAVAPTKSGYVRELVVGPAGQALPAGLSRSSVTSFAFVAHPVTPGQTGVRSFCGDSSGRVCSDPAGRPNLVDKTGQEVMCSMTCQDF